MYPLKRIDAFANERFLLFFVVYVNISLTVDLFFNYFYDWN